MSAISEEAYLNDLAWQDLLSNQDSFCDAMAGIGIDIGIVKMQPYSMSNATLHRREAVASGLDSIQRMCRMVREGEPTTADELSIYEMVKVVARHWLDERVGELACRR